jgi:uncharacterized membrane protein
MTSEEDVVEYRRLLPSTSNKCNDNMSHVAMPEPTEAVHVSLSRKQCHFKAENNRESHQIAAREWTNL